MDWVIPVLAGSVTALILALALYTEDWTWYKGQENAPRTQINKKFFLSLMIGVILTVTASIVIPPMFDPFVATNKHIYSRLEVEDEIVTLLKTVQYDEGVVIGLHGYRHVSPIDGVRNYEFWHPQGVLTIGQLKVLTNSCTRIFSDIGITRYLFVPPGDMVDEQGWDLFKVKGLEVVKGTRYTIAFTPQLSPDKIQALKQTIEAPYGEYTWAWRNMRSFNDPRYAEAVERVAVEKPAMVVLHQQDLNKYTSRFLRELPYHPVVFRCDDYTLEVDKVEELIDIARSHNAVAVPAVIPSFVRPGNLLFQVWSKVYFGIFLGFVVLPSVVLLSWYGMVRRERSVR